MDRSDTEHDRKRRRRDSERDRKEDSDRKDHERDEDLELDIGDLDNAQHRHKLSRKADDSTAEPMQQGADGHGMYSISSSTFDDKNALKSKSHIVGQLIGMFDLVNFVMLLYFTLLCNVIIFPSSTSMSSAI